MKNYILIMAKLRYNDYEYKLYLCKEDGIVNYDTAEFTSFLSLMDIDIAFDIDYQTMIATDTKEKKVMINDKKDVYLKKLNLLYNYA